MSLSCKSVSDLSIAIPVPEPSQKDDPDDHKTVVEESQILKQTTHVDQEMEGKIKIDPDIGDKQVPSEVISVSDNQDPAETVKSVSHEEV